MRYDVVYEREPDGRWTVAVPDVPGCHTYGRTIEQARERIREALSLFVNDAETAKFNEQIQLPDDVRQMIQTAKQLRERVMLEEANMLAAQKNAVHVLRQMKLGHRDAGVLLGLSHQRVQQLEHRKVPTMPGAVITASLRSRGHHVIRKAAKKR